MDKNRPNPNWVPLVRVEHVKTQDEKENPTIPGLKSPPVTRGINVLKDDALVREYMWARGTHDSRGKRREGRHGEPIQPSDTVHSLACRAELVKRGLAIPE